MLVSSNTELDGEHRPVVLGTDGPPDQALRHGPPPPPTDETAGSGNAKTRTQTTTRRVDEFPSAKRNELP